MKKLLIVAVSLKFASMFAMSAEDSARAERIKAEIKADEKQVETLHKSIEDKRSKLALFTAEAHTRAAEAVKAPAVAH